MLDLMPHGAHRWARVALAVASGVLGRAPCGYAQPAFPSDSAIRAVLDARIAANRNAAIVVGLVGPGGTRVIAAGVADEQRPDVRLDGNTVFEIGSITKVFTGALLAEMVARGEVGLDDPVRSLLPATVTFPVHGGREIALIDLATHRSGLPRMPSNFAPRNANNPYADYSVDQLYTFLSQHVLTRGVGEGYEYSNLAVGLLGHVLALKGNSSYEALLTERILAPLGMSDTRITLTPSMRDRLARGHYVTGYPAENWDIPTLAGAGALRSTVNDMLTFAAANLDPTGAGIRAALRQAHTVQREGPGNAPPVGLNWHINRRRGREFLWHNGQTGGYHSYLALDAANRMGVVVLTNTSFTIDGIGLWLLDSTTSLTRLGAIPVRKEIALPSDALDVFVGEYRLNPSFAITVTRDGSALFIQATGQGRLRAVPESELRFFLREVDAQLSFTRDASGMVNELILHQGGADLRLQRVR